MADANDLTRMVPGFDFLQGLLKNAGTGLPSMGQWVAPTLSPQELEKRIQELKTVQFWLEQNAKLLAATIQALEVQRMTLATLQSLNLPLVDLGNALKIKPQAPAAVPAESATTPAAKSATKKASPPASTSSTASPPAPAAVDPLQWWGALTQQFGDLAAKAFKETAVDAAQNLAGTVVKQSLGSAASVLKKSAVAATKKAVQKSRR